MGIYYFDILALTICIKYSENLLYMFIFIILNIFVSLYQEQHEIQTILHQLFWYWYFSGLIMNVWGKNSQDIESNVLTREMLHGGVIMHM